MVLLFPLRQPILQMGTLRLREVTYITLRKHCCQTQIPVPIVQWGNTNWKVKSLEQKKAYFKGQADGQLMFKKTWTHPWF